MIRFAFILVCALLLPSTVQSAQPYTPILADPVLDPRRWSVFPELQGLGVQCMTEDRDGNVWFGVRDGVVRYDGVQWETFTPEDGLFGSPVIALLGVSDGSVYAGSYFGISRYHDGQWRKVFPLKGDLPARMEETHCLRETSDGSIWAALSWGALRLHGEHATLYTQRGLGSALRELLPDVGFEYFPEAALQTGALGEELGIRAAGLGKRRAGPWLVVSVLDEGPARRAGLLTGDRIVAVDGNTTKTITNIPPGKTIELTIDRPNHPELIAVTLETQDRKGQNCGVADILEDQDGRLWFTMVGGGIVCYSQRAELAGDNKWLTYSEKDGLAIGDWPKIAETPNGTIWTSSWPITRGLNRLTPSTGSLSSRETAPGAWSQVELGSLGGDDRVWSMVVSKDGTLWVVGNHLYTFNQEGWRFYSRDRRADLGLPTMQSKLRVLYETSDGAMWLIGEGEQAARLEYTNARWTTWQGIHYQCETPDGSQWFLARDGGVVVRNGRVWNRFDSSDGLPERTDHVFATQDGDVWAAGAHEGIAATARLDGQRWIRQSHMNFAASILSVYASSRGSLWFGSTALRDLGAGGVLEFNPGHVGTPGAGWQHHTPPGPPVYTASIGETRDGNLWFGWYRGLHLYDGESWAQIEEVEEISEPAIDAVLGATNGDLWIAHRRNGVYRYDGQVWRQYSVSDGLASNRARTLFETSDGHIWLGTSGGVSRFDGHAWTTEALPPPHRFLNMNQSRDGALWLFPREEWRTTRYLPETNPPDTRIKLYAEEVSQPGNTTLTWEGVDPWNQTPTEELNYSIRLDDGDWSPYSPSVHVVLEHLSSGKHIFQVRSRDRDFNADPTPAMVAFRVIAPVWQQMWFIAMVSISILAIALQTQRVIRRDRRLLRSNQALSDANRELFTVNTELQRERAAERIRAEVQTMDRVEDFDRVLSLLAEDLKRVGLVFDLCEIDALPQAPPELSLTYFETNGFVYTTYTLDPSGEVSSEPYAVSAPFPPVIRQTVERFVAGEPWRGASEGQAIVEVPVAGYGRLRLTTSQRDRFSDGEVDTLREFADAVALGYTRFADIRKIQENTGRKAAFLAGMSHELRTPMNAIKGFCSLVLRREKALSDRGRENLEKVDQASDHLLAMINDLLDLSKIEAGRMDVNATSFDVKKLVVSACGTVQPLVREGVELKVEVDEAGEAYTDEGRVRQMLLNLLSNALKFTERGTVTVRASSPDVEHSALSDSQLVISVSDTGKGIPAGEIPMLFDEYRQVKDSDREHKGTGLGLSITKQFAELLGGSIGVQSAEGEGSTFTIRIPSTRGSESG